MLMTSAQREQYREEGWCVLPGAMPPKHLAALRAECARFIARKDAEMDAAGVDVMGITHRGSRYFVKDCHANSADVRDFVLGDVMADVCRGTLGEEAYLLFDQYVVKGAEGGMPFSWHQDSGYINANGGDLAHPAYLTAWCPLDDVSEANGTVYLLPYSRLGIKTWVRHEKDPTTNDWVGYFGSDRGVVVECPAGSVVLFSSFVFHSSGANTTADMRRVFLAQYSSRPLMRADGSRPWAHAIPVLQGGRHVAAREMA